jgi:hypothetical protein
MKAISNRTDYLYLPFLCIGGGVHHPNLTEDKEADDDGAEDVLNEKDLRKIGFEAQILRMVTSGSTVTT